MKVVLFCGGRGLRLREHAQSTPKPLAHIGTRPILWHLMKYYAFYGHEEFILCLGDRPELLKQYFLEYQETLSNDFILRKGGQQIELLNSDIGEWTIRFADTGLLSNIGERLMAVRRWVENEEVFLANYADGLTDLPLDRYVDHFLSCDKAACFISVRPNAPFHLVVTENELVREIKSVSASDMRINGGFFIFRPRIFDYMRPGEELVEEPFGRLIADEQIMAYRYDGFWQCMDTFKDKQALEDLEAQGQAPWMIWRNS